MTGTPLDRYPLFRLLSDQQLAGWLADGQEVELSSGTMIFEENTPGAWVHAVLAGKVRLVRQSGRRELSLGMLLPGDVFGEYALLPPGNNTATCRTAAVTRLLRLPLGPLRAAVEGMEPVRRNLKNWLRLHTLLHYHRERTFLGFMSGESALKLHDRLKPVTVAAGQTVQASGLAEECWHLIEQGAVSVEGADLGPGETFGERALLGAGPLPTAVAKTEVRCLVLTRQAFDPSAPARSLVAQSYEPRTPGRPTSHVWVSQLEKADCGLASLAMVAARLGKKVSVEELRRGVELGTDGLNLARLRAVAASVGLACQSALVSVDRLGQVSLPAIAHLSDGHYVVLHELGAGGVVVGDPATGVGTWSRDHLARVYSGALILFEGTGGNGSASTK